MKYLIPLFALLLLHENPIFAQDETQLLDVKSFTIEKRLVVRNGSGHEAVFDKKIYLRGKPSYNNYTVETAELHFTSDSLTLSNKPNYVSSSKTIIAYYPLIEFNDYVEMLKYSRKTLRLTYSKSQSMDISKVIFEYTADLPLR